MGQGVTKRGRATPAEQQARAWFLTHLVNTRYQWGWQWPDGSYFTLIYQPGQPGAWDNRPLSDHEVLRHLRHQTTLLLYRRPVRRGGPFASQWLCLDLDFVVELNLHKRRALAEEVYTVTTRRFGPSPVALEDSGSGYHLWTFFAQEVAVPDLAAVGVSLRDQVNLRGHRLQIIPQEVAAVKAPLSLHRKNGHFCALLDPQTFQPYDDQLGFLASIQPGPFLPVVHPLPAPSIPGVPPGKDSYFQPARFTFAEFSTLVLQALTHIPGNPSFRLSAACVLVGLEFAQRHFSPKGTKEVFRSVRDLAADCQISLGKTKTVLETLREHQLIETQNHPNAWPERLAALHRLNAHRASAVSPPTPPLCSNINKNGLLVFESFSFEGFCAGLVAVCGDRYTDLREKLRLNDYTARKVLAAAKQAKGVGVSTGP